MLMRLGVVIYCCVMVVCCGSLVFVWFCCFGVLLGVGLILWIWVVIYCWFEFLGGGVLYDLFVICWMRWLVLGLF